MRLSELARRIEAVVVGDGELEVTSCATLEEAGAGQVSFLANPKYMKQVETTKATAVVVGHKVESGHVALLKARDPYYAFTQALVILHGHRKHPHAGIHPRAHVDPTAAVGEGTVIYPGVYVGPRAKVGRDCTLYPNAVVYDDCILGDRVTVHAGAVIGVDGFGYATHAGEDKVAMHHKIPQTGNVVLEDDVEIGANCTVQRAAMGSTVIGKGTKFGDLISIGHGVRIGAHGLLVGLNAVAGSTTVGHHMIMGGQAGIAGHLKLGDNVTIAAQAGVMSAIKDQTTVLGTPAMDAAHGRKVYVGFMQLPELMQRIKQLEQKVEELGAEGSEDNETMRQ